MPEPLRILVFSIIFGAETENVQLIRIRFTRRRTR